MTRCRVLVLVLLAVLTPACARASDSSSSTSAAPAGPPFSFVSMGGSETEGDGLTDRIRAAWPYVFFRETLPRETTFVNAAIDDSTLEHALTDQVPLVEENRPDLVAIFLGVDDLREHTPLDTFRTRLDEIMTRVDRAGVKRVLIGLLPAVYGADAPEYNGAIRNVAGAHHAVLVPLEDAAVTFSPGTDGITRNPDAASQRLIADKFGTAYERAS